MRLVSAQSDPDAPPCCETVVHANIYDAENHSHATRELGRYIEAAHTDMKGQRMISMAGPDSTKVGTDFSVTMAASMNSKTQKVSLGAPQEPNMIVQ